jgi:Uma2 family endonuclease
VTQLLITAEEFAQMPDPLDGSQQELVRGVIISTPLPGARHGACCARIVWHVGGYAEDHNLGVTASNNSGVILARDPDTVRAPDVAFWKHEKLPEIPSGYADVAPDLVIEVISRTDRFALIQQKVNDYLEKGIRLIWVVDPEDRSLTFFHGEGKPIILNENDTVTGADVLPGFMCRVADLLP